MAAWWPVVQAALVELLPTLPEADGFVPHDGPPVSEKGSPRWYSVGYASTENSGGSVDGGDGPITGMREETGTVLCEFVSWSGDDEVPTHRTATFALYDALNASVRADQTFGVLPASSTVELSATPIPGRDKTGTAHRLIVTVSYFVRS